MELASGRTSHRCAVSSLQVRPPQKQYYA